MIFLLSILGALLVDIETDPALRRRAASRRFWSILEEIAGPKQIVYVGPFQIVGDRKGGILAKLEVRVVVGAAGETPVVHIGYIGVNREDRQKGYGSRVLGMLTEAADRAGFAMDLEVDPQTERGEDEPPMTETQLVGFYRKFGFESSGEDPAYMVRLRR